MSLMRYNDFMHDTYSKCDFSPLGCSAGNAISARYDLNPVNGTYKIVFEGANCFGATDLKLTNKQMVESMQMVAISGPTRQQQSV